MEAMTIRERVVPVRLLLQSESKSKQEGEIAAPKTADKDEETEMTLQTMQEEEVGQIKTMEVEYASITGG